VVLHNKFDERRVADSLRTGAVTIASFVPTMLYRLLEFDRGPYSGMRAVLLGGAAAQRQLVERGLEAGLPILQTYGMTETCSQAATVVPGEAIESLGSAGRPLPDVTLTTGEAGVGEVVISGPTVSPGYLGEPDREGDFHTGDIGYIDDHGRLVVLGRVDDMIVTGGENVYPQHVADVLGDSGPGVRVEVVAIPDPEWGQALVAIVVGGEHALPGLQERARELLPKYELPKHWIHVDRLPMLPGGKVDRIALAEIARRAH
jgi:O-succinylbenzoic acid--CoA ligase